MEIKIDWEKYAKNLLKKMEKQLRSSKNEYEKEILKEDIKRHKEKYSSYLK